MAGQQAFGFFYSCNHFKSIGQHMCVYTSPGISRRKALAAALDWFYDRPPPQTSGFFNERFMAARHQEGCEEKISSCIFLFAKDYQTMTSGWQGAPYFSRYGRELVSKPAISSKKCYGGYRRTTHKSEVLGGIESHGRSAGFRHSLCVYRNKKLWSKRPSSQR